MRKILFLFLIVIFAGTSCVSKSGHRVASDQETYTYYETIVNSYTESGCARSFEVWKITFPINDLTIVEGQVIIPESAIVDIVSRVNTGDLP